MTRFRSRIGQRAAPSPVQGMPAQPVLPDPSRYVVTDEAARLDARKLAEAVSLVHLGQNETFELVGELQNLNTTAPAVSVPAVIISFQVPVGQVLRIDALSVDCSHPVFFTTRSIGWRLAVSNGRLPNMFSVGSDFFSVAVGSVGGPMKLEPFWVQSEQVIQVQGVAVGVLDLMDSSNTLFARLTGRIFRPASPKVLSPEVSA